MLGLKLKSLKKKSMCARVKGWWEHNRVKANPTITQKHTKIPRLQ